MVCTGSVVDQRGDVDSSPAEVLEVQAPGPDSCVTLSVSLSAAEARYGWGYAVYLQQ